jgi:2'-5' RNA ligase
VSWVAPENLHVTLKFLGSIDDLRVQSVIDVLHTAVRGQAPFELEVVGLGAFPSATRPRVLWAGIVGGAGPLAALAAAVEDALAGLGFPRETRAFSPHITLARIREPGRAPALAEALGAASGRRFGRVAVANTALMRSDLSPWGARYTALASVAL